MGGINHQKWVVYYCYTHIILNPGESDGKFHGKCHENRSKIPLKDLKKGCNHSLFHQIHQVTLSIVWTMSIAAAHGGRGEGPQRLQLKPKWSTDVNPLVIARNLHVLWEKLGK